MVLIRSNRDLRVDFFRGLALWWIFADHIPDNWIARFSLQNFALCDATEVFVLLAGYAAGLAYGRSMDRHGWVFAGADVLKRAWTLYVAHNLPVRGVQRPGVLLRHGAGPGGVPG